MRRNGRPSPHRAARVPWAPDFGTGTPGPSEPAAPGLSFPRLPAEWLPAVVGPGVALGLLLIAFVISRRSERTRRHKSAGRNNRRTSKVTQAAARSRATSRPRRYIPPNEFEDDPSEF